MSFRRNAQFLLLRARVFQTALAALGLVLMVRVIWGWEATLRLANVRSQIPLLPFPDGPDSDEAQVLSNDRNAAAWLTRAIHAVHIEESDLPGRSDGRPAPFGRGWGPRLEFTRLRPLLQANAAALELIDKAVHTPEVRWPITPRSVEDASAGPAAMTNAFPLRILLSGAADIAHQNGNDVEALEDLHRLLGVAHILDLAPDLFSHVVAAGMRSEVAVTLERWDLRPQGPAIAPTRQFLDTLFNEQSTSSVMIARSFDYETSAYDRWITQSLPSLSEWWLRPLATDAFARRLSLQQKIAPITQANNWQQVVAIPLPTPLDRNNLNIAAMTLSEPRLDIVEVMRMHFRAQTDVRAGLILLAANLYRAEKGNFPPTLSSLIPSYVPSAPVDPFDGHAQFLHYRLDPHGPTVWSVGENGLDDGGTIIPFGSGPGTGGGGPGAGGRGFSAFGFGMGFGGGRRYSQADIVYGASWRDSYLLGRGF